MSANPEVVAFLDKPTGSLTYLVADPDRKRAAIVDPALEYDPATGRIGTAGADRIAADVERRGLAVDWILETHIHADRPSAAGYLRGRLGGRLAIGARVTAVQTLLKADLGLGDFAVDGSQFDHLFADGESFRIGSIKAHALSTPGHTPACVSYLVGDALFVGDTIFMPDGGTARCDFSGGDARTLYASIKRLYRQPPETRVFCCHDYAQNRDFAWETTIAAERGGNIHVNDKTAEDEFVAFRTTRDATLKPPALLRPSLAINLGGGRLPAPGPDGALYFKGPAGAA